MNRLFKSVVALALLCLALTAAKGASLGSNPAAGLVRGSDGSLYGTTANGGTSGLGTVFKIDPKNNNFVTTLVNFTGVAGANPGATPLAALIFGSDGKLYGTTSEGGANNFGTVFRVSVTGIMESLYSFGTNANDGAYPKGKLVQGADGNYYGTTYGGAITASFQGIVFRITPNGTETVLFTFTGAEGAFPTAGLTLGRDGNFYGVAVAGGDNGLGTIFKMTTSGVVSPLYSFDGGANGSNPQGELVEDPSTVGTFYGVTTNGGSSGYGALFKIITSSATVSAIPFNGATLGADPRAGLIVAADGLLYGTCFAGGSNNLGTLFRSTRPSLALTKLADFTGSNGSGPDGPLLEDSAHNGTFLGTTYAGGVSTSGTVFSITPPGAITTIVDFANANGSAPPVITSATTATVDLGTNFVYQITATNNPTSYAAIGLPSFLVLDTNTGAISGTITTAGNYSFTISATNTSGTGSAGFQLIVLPDAPSITSTTTASGQVGQPFSYQIIATNNPFAFGATGLPSGLTLTNSSTGVISGTPATPGVYDVLLSATNGSGTGSATLHLTISEGAPVITSVLEATVLRPPLGSPPPPPVFNYKITANNNPTSYDAFVLPAGLTIDHVAGTIIGTPVVEGTYKFTIAATNAGGTGSATFTLTVLPPAPIINSPSTATGIVGQGFVYQITTVEPIITPINPVGGGKGSAFAAFGIPVGTFLDDVNGTISGFPEYPGVYQVVLEAGNTGGIGAKTLTITIDNQKITSPLSVTGTVGEFFFYQITAPTTTGGFGVLTFSASPLPPGLSVDTASGVISGTPTTAGAYSTVITSISGDPAQPPVSAVLTITITPAIPVITSPTSASGQQYQYFSYQITALGEPTSYTATGLPSGLSISASTGLISGKPSVAGDFTVTISASNSQGTGSANLLLSIASAGTTLIHFDQSSFPAVSTEGSVSITVDALRATGDDGPITLNYATSDGTAKSGIDYLASSGTVTFSGTDSQQVITIPLLPQSAPALDRTFTVTLSNASHGTLGAPTQATVVISYPDLSTKATNISTRGFIGYDQEVMIAGFIATGEAMKEVVVRGLGPSLTALGVIGAISDPMISLMDANGTEVASNDDYGAISPADLGTLVGYGLVPSDSRESALVANLPVGNYTAILRGKTNGFGMVELYDVTSTRLSRFVNISTRAKVESGDNGALIAGFIIQAPENQAGTPQQVLIRAIGPSLSSNGITGALADPTLDLYRGSQLILSNDNWKTTDQTGIQATGIPPTNDKESALLVTLDPGSYTAVVRGKNNTTGVALVEVYQLP